MQFEKSVPADLPYCYAAMEMEIDGRETCSFAPDADGRCIAIPAGSPTVETVWEGPGGTMSMIPVLGRSNEFLASRRFFPEFHARVAEIVRVFRGDGKWKTELLTKLPYAHRFDLIRQGNRQWLLGCILSGTDREAANFENPGAPSYGKWMVICGLSAIIR